MLIGAWQALVVGMELPPYLVPSPADIGLDTKRGRVAIPLLMEDRVEFRQLPAGKGAGPS